VRRRYRVKLVSTVVFAALLVPATALAYAAIYANGKYFFAGDDAGSVYDEFCGPTYGNAMDKTTSSWGLVTFIDANGYHWHGTSQGYGYLYIEDLGPYYRKKAYCQNNSNSAYFATCTRFYTIKSGCVVA
jgi:hypothetical protein